MSGSEIASYYEAFLILIIYLFLTFNLFTVAFNSKPKVKSYN
jgi:hypothetical protein